MRTFFSLLKQALQDAIDCDSFTTAKGAAYSLVLAFFPTLLLVANALAGTTTTSSLAKELVHALDRVIPPSSKPLVAAYFSGQTEHPLKIILSAAAIALFGASGVTGSFITGVREAYRLKSNWSFWHEEGVAVALVFMAGTPMMTATVLVVFGQQVQVWMMQRTEFPWLVLLAGAAVRWIIAIMTGTLVVGMVYYSSPNCEDRFTRVLPGALLATMAWLAACAIFAWYVQNVAEYSGIYGNLATIIVLMVWMYLLAAIVLVGAQFNAVRERRRRAKI